MVAPYATPIAYSPMYHPAAALYTQPSMAAAAVACPTVEFGNGNKLKEGSGKSGDGGKVTLGSVDNRASQSDCSSGSEGWLDTIDKSTDPQNASRKRSSGDAFGKGRFSWTCSGETSQPITAAQNTAELTYSGKERTASKLPVSAPGRAALPDPATNLSIGMDLWSTSHVGTAPVNVRANSVNIASTTAGANGVMPEHQWLQQDDHELKRERRKLSNRESARRSRMRKQQECEDLARKVAELSSENCSLKIELDQLSKVCKDLEAANASIVGKLNCTLGRGVASELLGINCKSSRTMPCAGGEGSGRVPQNPVGSNGKMYSSGHNFASTSR